MSNNCVACQRDLGNMSTEGICPQCRKLHDLQVRAGNYLAWQGNKTPKQDQIDRIAGWLLQIDMRRAIA